MKVTVGFRAFERAFADYGIEGFSHQGLRTMFDYYEALENELDEEFELDPIAFNCEWRECTIDELYNDYSYVLNYEDWLSDYQDGYDLEDIQSGKAMNDFLYGDFLYALSCRKLVLKVDGSNTYLVSEDF